MSGGRRPRVVALGGGHGLASTLQAVRRYAGEVTAVVSVADDGGSSGRLREAFGIPAPGDLRRCLIALGDPNSLWARAFDHRFEAGELEGHAFGNVVIAGLTATTNDFQSALEEAGRLVGAVGRVLPATVEPVVLKAEVDGPTEVEGQVRVQESRGIRHVSLVPADAGPPDEVLEAIDAADQIVIGPGSLYTSVLPVLIVPRIRAALADTRAERIYVCNLRPQVPETEGYDVAAHLAALDDHGIEVDVVVYDTTSMRSGALPETGGPKCVEGPYAKADGTGHDPVRLAATLADRLR